MYARVSWNHWIFEFPAIGVNLPKSQEIFNFLAIFRDKNFLNFIIHSRLINLPIIRKCQNKFEFTYFCRYWNSEVLWCSRMVLNTHFVQRIAIPQIADRWNLAYVTWHTPDVRMHTLPGGKISQLVRNFLWKTRHPKVRTIRSLTHSHSSR